MKNTFKTLDLNLKQTLKTLDLLNIPNLINSIEKIGAGAAPWEIYLRHDITVTIPYGKSLM